MNILFVSHVPSFHISPLICEISKIPDTSVTVWIKKSVDTERLAQGWSQPEYGNAKVMYGDHAPLQDCIRDTAFDIYVFSSYVNCKEIRQGLLTIKKSGARYYILSEGRCTYRTDFKGVAQRIYRLTTGFIIEKPIVDKAAGVFSIGANGVDWHKRLLKTDSARIVPFAYPLEPWEAVAKKRNGKVKLLYVGRLVELKNIGMVIEALADFDDISFEIYGDGPERNNLFNLAEKLNVKTRVKLNGSMSNETIRKTMSSYDALILPSFEDGWGMVVSEALYSGIPVILSDACGSRMVVKNGINGYIFSSNDPISFKSCVKELVLNIDYFREASKLISNSIYPYLSSPLAETMMTHFSKGQIEND